MKVVDAQLMADMKIKAVESPRGRTHFNLHDELSDPIQRVVMALEPGTYVRPHRHADGVWELFALLEGAITVLIFTPDGTVVERVELREGGARMVQVPPGAWHSLIAEAPRTVAFEVKPGPYRPAEDKNFAAWAPREGEAGAADMVRWMEQARPGNRVPVAALS